MSTMLRLGPGDHRRPMTYDEYMSGDYEEGYRYEIIEGRLYVSPMPNLPHDLIETYVYRHLDRYSDLRPDILNYVTTKARVFVTADEETTAPEPDVAVYRDFPRNRKSKVDWRDVSPILVVEVLGGEDDDKDLVRNPDLYYRVPTIQEYWVFDIREDSDRPKLRVFRRQPQEWEVLDFDADTTYRTPLLPGFELPVTPSE